MTSFTAITPMHINSGRKPHCD